MIRPTTNMGRLSSCPMETTPASSPKCASGSRKSSTKLRQAPYPAINAQHSVPGGRGRRPSTHSTPKSRRPSSKRSEEHTSELQSQSNLVCRLLLEKKKKNYYPYYCVPREDTPNVH